LILASAGFYQIRQGRKRLQKEKEQSVPVIDG